MNLVDFTTWPAKALVLLQKNKFNREKKARKCLMSWTELWHYQKCFITLPKLICVTATISSVKTVKTLMKRFKIEDEKTKIPCEHSFKCWSKHTSNSIQFNSFVGEFALIRVVVIRSTSSFRTSNKSGSKISWDAKVSSMKKKKKKKKPYNIQRLLASVNLFEVIVC